MLNLQLNLGNQNEVSSNLYITKGKAENIRKEAMDAFPQAQEFFSFRCKIEGDSCIGSTWAETH